MDDRERIKLEFFHLINEYNKNNKSNEETVFKYNN
jgi:hypothetical protein